MIWLHAGMHKTGSTAFQVFCKANRQLLDTQGIRVAATGYPTPQAVAHHELAWQLQDADRGDGSKDHWALLLDEYRKLEGKDLLVSSEGFDLVDPLKVDNPEFRELLPEIRVIFYLRRQDLFFEANFKQRAKRGRARLEQFPHILRRKRERGNYWAMISPWIELLGKERLVVKPYDRNRLRKGDIIDDLLSILGMDELPDAERPAVPRNPTPSRALLEFLETIDEAGDPERTEQVFWKLARNLPADFMQTADLLSPDERFELLQGFADCNERLRANFSPGETSFFAGVDRESARASYNRLDGRKGLIRQAYLASR